MSGIFARIPDAPRAAQAIDRLAPDEGGVTLARFDDDDPRTGAAQPLTLDGRTWIVADARLDDRATLRAALGGGRHDTPDRELILRAFARWDERVVDYLLGDFAFAIWDADRRRLFCARDHLGVRPLYYAPAGAAFVVASTLAAVRRHPGVDARLDDLALADFLLFGFSQDPAATAFRGVRRLPPAHTLTWQDGRLRVARYWTLPIEAPLELRRDEEYVERFTALLRTSIADRLGEARSVSLFMSGGIDSTLLAATALDVLRRPGGEAAPVRGWTIVYETSIPDDEGRYAGAAAGALGVPLETVIADDRRGWPSIDAARSSPEPAALADGDADARCHAAMAAHDPLVFYGEGPDNALVYEWRSYLRFLWHGRRYGRLVADAARFARHHRRLPLLGTLHARLRGTHRTFPAFPSWIEQDLDRRFDLRARWAEALAPSHSAHPIRPRAHGSLGAPAWQSVFESMHPAHTRAHLDFRHPYLDLRVLRFLLRVPVIPWCREKHLLRLALRGRVPETVRRRKKTPLRGDPLRARVRRDGLPPMPVNRAIERFGSLEEVRRLAREDSPEVGHALRLVALGHWLDAIT